METNLLSYHLEIIHSALSFISIVSPNISSSVEITAFRGPLVLGFAVNYEIFIAVLGG